MGVKSILFNVTEVNGHKVEENGLVVSAQRVFDHGTHWQVIDKDGNEWICGSVENYRKFTKEEL